MVETRHRKAIDVFEPLEILRFPFFTENLLVMLLFIVMFTIASLLSSLPGFWTRSGPIWFVSITLFCNYAFVVVDYTSRGLQRVPKLSGDLVFPTYDSRYFAIAGLTILYLAFLLAPTDLQLWQLLVAFFTYPLTFTMLIVHQSPLALFNIPKMAKTLWLFSTSRTSIGFYALQFATGAMMYFNFVTHGEISPVNLFWQVPISICLLLMLFRSLGVVLNTQGPKFGVAILQNAETYEAALAEEARIVLDEFILKLHRWVRVHEYDKAWDMIAEHQREHRRKFDAPLFTRLCEWDDKRLAVMLGADMSEELIKGNDIDRAMKVFRESYDMAPNRFRFSSGLAALQMAGKARDAATKNRMIKFLLDFERVYPEHPSTKQAFIKAAELAESIDDPVNARLARQLVEQQSQT